MKIPKKSPYPGALLEHMKREERMSPKKLARHEAKEGKAEMKAEKELRPRSKRLAMKKKLKKAKK